MTFHRMNTNIHAHKDHLYLYIAFSVLFPSLSQSRFIVETILFSTTNSFLWQIIILNWTYFKLTFCYHAYFWSNQSLSTYYVNGIINPLPVHINYFLLFFLSFYETKLQKQIGKIPYNTKNTNWLRMLLLWLHN